MRRLTAGGRLADPGYPAAEVFGRAAAGHHLPYAGGARAATLDRLSNGRALFNLVTGGDPEELAAEGLHLSHEERYEASTEFTHIWRRVLEGETVDFDGKHIQVKGAKLLYPPVQQPRLPLYFGGSSAAAQDLAAEQVELYLTGRAAGAG